MQKNVHRPKKVANITNWIINYEHVMRLKKGFLILKAQILSID